MDIRSYNQPILMFSGGKDSLLCLLKLKEYLDIINVVWVNTGKNIPEVETYVKSFQKMCPNWIELKANRDMVWAAHGLPADVIHPHYTVSGHRYTMSVETYQSPLECCVRTLMPPVIELIVKLGSNLLIRGNKVSDALLDKSRSGDVIDGVTIYNPIENLTDYQVLECLKVFDVELPAWYGLKHSSIDCADCTGYIADSGARIDLLKHNYHEEYDQLIQRLKVIVGVVEEPLNSIKEVLK